MLNITTTGNGPSTLPVGALPKACATLAMFGNKLDVEHWEHTGLRVGVRGDLGSGVLWVRGAEGAVVPGAAVVKQSFALAHVQSMSKRATSYIIRPDEPLLLQYEVEGGGLVRFYLAPMFDDDDE